MRGRGIWLPVAALVVALLPPARGVAEEWSRTVLPSAEGGFGLSFGQSVAITDQAVLVGEPRTGASGEGSGVVHVFERSAGSWRPAGRLAAAGLVPGAWFGTAVALQDGVAVVGANEIGVRPRPGDIAVARPGKAPWAASAPRLLAGAAHVFRRGTTGWSEETRLVPGDGVFQARFGAAVALDGDRVAVGAPGQDGGAGAVYVFRRTNGTWRQEAKLSPDGGDRREIGDAVALAGGLLAAGSRSGRRVYIFRLGPRGWGLEATLDDPAPRAGTGFGLGLSLRGDDLLVGAPAIDDSFPVPPTAYFYRRQEGRWARAAELASGEPGIIMGYGRWLALRGEIAAIAGDREIYVFRQEDGVWRLNRKIPLLENAQSGYVTAVGADGNALAAALSLWGGNGSGHMVIVFESRLGDGNRDRRVP